MKLRPRYADGKILHKTSFGLFCQLGNPQTYAEKADGFFCKKLTATKYAKSSAKKSHGSFAKDNKIDAKS